MNAVFPTLARVMPSDEWLAALGRPGGGGGPDGSPQKTAGAAGPPLGTRLSTLATVDAIVATK